MRPLGIPTVLDRFIQQAVMQVLQADWDGTFSAASFGFRPGRAAHQAVEQAQGYIASGHAVVVDIDLEKFFDRVNHDMRALQGDLEDRGGVIAFNTRIDRLVSSQAGWLVSYSGSDSGELAVDAVINSAGLGAQALARHTEDYPTARVPRLVLARGNYFGYAARPVFSRLIYPAPRIDGGLGIHVTLDLAGRMRFGPDVEWIAEENYDVNASRAASFYGAIRRYFPALKDGMLQPDYAGIRPKLTGPGEPAADFMIEAPRQHGLPRLVHLFGIESLGLTSALSLADAVVAEIEA